MKQLVKIIVSMVALAVFAVAFAQSDQARIPPRDGCAFENGRTTCVVTTEETVATLSRTIQILDTSCGMIPVREVRTDYELIEVYETTTVYFGNSYDVESEDTELIDTREDVLGTEKLGCVGL